MAIAERFLAERFNRPGQEVVDHHSYAICSDGDMMEGISQEAASIAGHFGLGKLVVCYDDNHITIDGTTTICFDGENHTARLEADGWHVQRVEDSEDLDALEAALAAAREEAERPSFIAIRSHIAYPAPNAVDTAKSHGRGARRGRGARDQGGDGLRSRASASGWTSACTSTCRCATAAQARRRVAGALRGLARGLPRAGRGLGPRLGGPPARRLARGAAELRGRREGRDARRPGRR